MTHSIERECTECGYVAYAKRNAPCTSCEQGIMAKVIKQKLRRVVGVLCRDKTSTYYNQQIVLFTGVKSSEIVLTTHGTWEHVDISNMEKEWTPEEWQNEFGKLPRIGSKQMVILETNG